MFRGGRQKTKTGVLLTLVCFLFAGPAMALEISNRYRSPRNPERKIRSSTRLIVLHTTEAPARSSLNKVSDRGECHYCVTENGMVYRIVDRDREAFHAGRSMWQGAEDVDKYSVGIECVGFHNKAMPKVQIVAIRDLVAELQALYKIPDHGVVCHSHVAYGAPNKWHRYKHRGRKRCGMLFAMPSVRRALGLSSRPAFDPDTRAKRLRNADDYLSSVLYGRVDTMASVYSTGAKIRPAVPTPISRAPVKQKPPSKQSSKKVAKTVQKPAVKKIVKTTAKSSVKTSIQSSPRTVAELMSKGYTVRGTVTKERTALKIAGAKWNAPDTYYTIRDKVISGSSLNPSRIEKGMRVWMRK